MGFRQLLQRLAQVLDQRKIPYMIIGGQAVMVHGEPRQTLDVDLTVRMSPNNLDEIRTLLTEVGLTPASDEAFETLKRDLVLPTADPSSMIPVEIIFSPYGFEDAVIERAEVRKIGGVPIRFISATDLVIYKMIAGRQKDLEDVRGILRQSGPTLDFTRIKKDLEGIEKSMDRSDLLRLWFKVSEGKG